MPIKRVTFDILTGEFVRALNKFYETQGVKKVVGVGINGKGKVRTIKYYISDLETNDRVILFEKSYEVKTTADLLNIDVKHILYRELFYNCFAFYAINVEHIVKQRELEKGVDTTVPNVAEYPVTPDEAYTKEEVDETR